MEEKKKEKKEKEEVLGISSEYGEKKGFGSLFISYRILIDLSV